MEIMPYQSTAPLGEATPTWLPLPTWGLGQTHWTRALPVLGDLTFTLRELTLADAPSLCAGLTTEEVSRFISPPPTTVAGFERFIAWTHARRAKGQFACFGIVPAGATQAVGLIQLHVNELDGTLAEWGFVLARPYWGTGLFTAAARRVVSFAFAAMGLHTLVAHAAVPNYRGNGALRKLGARQTGLRPQAFERHGLLLDQFVWTITRETWWGSLNDRWHGTLH